jgi:sterol desaturase/sphingolipid hydroxylase (fatty acid hydroxylase superfamily)
VVVWWPVQEWLAHELILHAPPRKVVLILLAVAVSPLVWLGIARGRPKVAATGLAATAAMTLVYEWSHFLTHTSHRPRRQWYRTLQRRHRLHHFKDEHNWYGFTMPFVDDLLGTAPDPAGLPTSPTVRTLGVEDPRLLAG